MATYKDVLNESINALKQAGVEDYEFDAQCLLEFCTGKSKTYLVLHSADIAEESTITQMRQVCERRIKGEPLQYILGEWDFMSFSFYVGEGVLIPRPETELLVETAVNNIKRFDNPVVFDLCAGTGCIGISVAKICPNADVYLIEKSDKAYSFLLKNANKYQLKNITLVKADITEGFSALDLPQPDIILSNPPYIEIDEIKNLSKEVQKEPVMALNGGVDGFDFYRCIIDLWLPHIKRNGFAALECGDTQAQIICKMAADINNKASILKDYSKKDRIVCFDF
ncbi:MAG TPA: peptide chain release factor N(5)-glutamine methyltransferase [Clostridia bacterium]|nr:peptide chain release factor N(5)-glutamine methyltransferase [Clostridia bacterium]